MSGDNGNGSIGESTGLGPDWVIVLLGNRTLLGKCEFYIDAFSRERIPHSLNPVYQIEMRDVVQQRMDPQTKQPVMVQGRQRNIFPPSELDGFTSLVLPEHGIVVKPLSELSADTQAEMFRGVTNLEKVIADNARKKKIAAEADAASKLTSFGGGARKD